MKSYLNHDTDTEHHLKQQTRGKKVSVEVEQLSAVTMEGCSMVNCCLQCPSTELNASLCL